MAKQFILIAEDDKTYLAAYRSTLQSAGYEVMTVERGDEVIPALRKRVPDLLILDLLMPGKTGFHVLKELRGDKKLKDLRVVVASNLSQEIDKAKANEFGVLDYFIKSDISIFELTEKIKHILST